MNRSQEMSLKWFEVAESDLKYAKAISRWVIIRKYVFCASRQQKRP